jgi:hypothetical protein
MISSWSFAHILILLGFSVGGGKKQAENAGDTFIGTRRLSIAQMPWPIRCKAADGLWVTAAFASI